MISPLLTLDYETLAEDEAFRHPYLIAWNLATLGDADVIPTPRFALCVTPLPALFCTCGRYLFLDPDEEEPPW
jgi:hypothetical protein